MQEGLKKAVRIPLSLAERVNMLWPCLKEMVLYGNAACKSDLQVRGGCETLLHQLKQGTNKGKICLDLQAYQSAGYR